jgi:hypothetical protein
MLFMQATDLVSRKTFLKGWRYAVLLSFVAGMLLTDPSPVTQILMALPVVGLYFIGVWGGRFVGEGKIPFRWYHSWPLVLAALAVFLMLAFSDQINEWSAEVFGADQPPAAEGNP